MPWNQSTLSEVQGKLETPGQLIIFIEKGVKLLGLEHLVKITGIGQNQILRGLNGRQNSVHFNVLEAKTVHILERGRYDSQMVLEIITWH